MQKDSQEQGTVLWGQREKIYNGQMGIGLELRVGRESSVSRGGGADCAVEVYMSEEYGEVVTVLRQGEQLQE